MNDPTQLAEQFLQKRYFTLTGELSLRRYRQDWYQFDRRIYRSLPEDELRADITNFLREAGLGSKLNTHLVNNVRMNLESMCIVPHDVEWPARQIDMKWVTQPHCLVTKNGIIDLSSLREGKNQLDLLPHTPLLLSRVCLSYNYDPVAICPKWYNFLQVVLPEKDCQQLLQEIFGYCLTYDLSMQKFFMFVGSGANGKGVTLNILSRLLGVENVSAVPLGRFSGRHDLVETLGKLVNITNEVGTRLDEDILKQHVAGDLMHFDPKHKPSFTARPTAKLVNATNELPYVKDCSDGFWRRLVLLPFSVTIPESTRDHQLEERLASELSGILNWAIAGASSLFQRGWFLEPKAAILARQTWQRTMNPTGQFLAEEMELSEEGEIGKQELYQDYGDWCVQTGHRPESMQEFHRRVIQRFPSITEQRPRTDVDHRPRRYRGICRKSASWTRPD